MTRNMDDDKPFRMVIDTELCSAHGRCYSLAPHAFEPDESGFGRVTVESLAASERAQMERVVQLCPELAIRIEEIGDPDAPSESEAET
jgi:ferredoxin